MVTDEGLIRTKRVIMIEEDSDPIKGQILSQDDEKICIDFPHSSEDAYEIKWSELENVYTKDEHGAIQYILDNYVGEEDNSTIKLIDYSTHIGNIGDIEDANESFKYTISEDVTKIKHPDGESIYVTEKFDELFNSWNEYLYKNNLGI